MMKLAAALNERANLQDDLHHLQKRLEMNAKVQEGEKPAEDPAELLKELDVKLKRLEELIIRINRTNAIAVNKEGRPVAELIAHRDALQKRTSILRSFLDEASDLTTRYSRNEIKIYSSVNVASLQKGVDKLCAETRHVDEELQELNWTIDLM